MAVLAICVGLSAYQVGDVSAQLPPQGAEPTTDTTSSSTPIGVWSLPEGSGVELTFLDVGQGDALLVRAPEGATAMIDAGPEPPLRHLLRLGVDSLDLLVATHPHPDHISGMEAVLSARPVVSYMDNGETRSSQLYRSLMSTLQRVNVSWLEATPRTFQLGSVAIEVLPLPSVMEMGTSPSVGLVIRAGQFSALLVGDASQNQLTHWLDGGAVPDVNVLKAAHHGSALGFTLPFLQAARPEVVVLSVGADNPYLHPAPEALAAYGAVADTILRTDRQGDIVVLGNLDGSFQIATGDAANPEWGPVLGLPDDNADPGETVGADPAEGGSALPGEAPVRVTVQSGSEGDARRLNGEYAVLENLTGSPLSIGGWRLCDLSTRCFRFPMDARIEAGLRVVVFTGYGMSDGLSFFMNNDRPVWNDNGDEALVFDAAGAPVVRHVYE